jgi:hypothetical protein
MFSCCGEVGHVELDEDAVIRREKMEALEARMAAASPYENSEAIAEASHKLMEGE